MLNFGGVVSEHDPSKCIYVLQSGNHYEVLTIDSVDINRPVFRFVRPNLDLSMFLVVLHPWSVSLLQKWVEFEMTCQMSRFGQRIGVFQDIFGGVKEKSCRPTFSAKSCS